MMIERVLQLPVWAVVGLTATRSRPAYGVTAFLQRNGKRIVPVNPLGEPVHGQPGYRTLSGCSLFAMIMAFASLGEPIRRLCPRQTS